MVPILLAVGAVVGVVLVVTGGESGPELERVTTKEGIEVAVPAGWQLDPASPWTWRPAPGSVDSWTVATSCAGTCEPRSLAGWLDVSADLPTFVSARRDLDAGTLVEGREEVTDRARILTARTSTGGAVVAVAVFVDGAERYLECDLFTAGDPAGLDEAIVDACRAADGIG